MSIEIGKINLLTVVKILDFGAYVDGAEFGEILVPSRYLPEDCKVNDELSLFIYHVSEDRIIGTTEVPFGQVGESVYLKVAQINPVGTFMDWGLSKDLLVPYSEQAKPMEEGFSYVVHIYQDEESKRIVATTLLKEILMDKAFYLKDQEPVDLLIYGESPLGYKAVVNQKYRGLIFRNEVFQPIRIGQKLKGFIKQIREDKKIDICLQLPEAAVKDDLMQKVLDYLAQHQGVCLITDKSQPDDIYATFRISKAKYKRTLGRLLKQKKIRISKEKIELI